MKVKALIVIMVLIVTLRAFTITDDMGRNVTIVHYPPQRVVALTPALSEAVCLIKCNSLVGTVTPVTWPPKLVNLVKEGKVKIVGQYWNPNPELIASVKPDLILADVGSDWRLSGVLTSLGYPVIFVKGGMCPTVVCVAKDMILVGLSLGNETAGKTIASWILNNLTEAEKLVSNKTTIKTMLLFYPFTWGIYAVGNNTFINDLVEHLNAKNVFDNMRGWPKVPKELVLSKRVDTVILLGGQRVNLDKVKTDVASMGLKTKWVCVIFGKYADIIERPGPRLSEAPWVLYKALWEHSSDIQDGLYCWQLEGGQS